MSNALEMIRAKIAKLDAQLTDLRTTERELEKLDGAAPPREARAKAAVQHKARSKPAAATSHQTIGSAITDVLTEHGPLPAKRIAAQISETRDDISNRSVSFALQALKKRGAVKSKNGEWSLSGRRK